MKKEMKETQDIQKIPDGHVFTVVATEYEAVIGGAYKAGFSKDGKITLVYTDGERESYFFSIHDAQEILNKGMDNFFSIVGSVQSKRDVKEVLK